MGAVRTRSDLRTTGRHLTNREIYNYCKDCSIAKSHKLYAIIRNHCLSLELMGDLEEPNGDISHGFSNFSKGSNALLNSASLYRQFGQSVVYYSSEAILNRNRVPGSRVRDKNNANDGQEHVGMEKGK